MSNSTSLHFRTDAAINVIDITGEAASFVAESGFRAGGLLVFVNGQRRRALARLPQEVGKA